MLQFFKNTSSKGRNEKTFDTPDEIFCAEKNERDKSDAEILTEAENYYRNVKDVQIVIPNFSWDISRVINDKSCLCYFVQYLEQMSALPLIKFWLDIESYKSAADLVVQNKELNGDIMTYTIDGSSEELIVDSVETHVVDTSEITAATTKTTTTTAITPHRGINNTSNINKGNNSNSIDECKIVKNEEQNKNLDAYKTHNNKLKQLLVDARRMFYKYLKDENSTSYVKIPAEILERISDVLEIKNCDKNSGSECNECHEISVSILTSLFDSAQFYVFHYLEKVHLNAFCESAYYSRYCIDVFTSDNLQITDILYNEDILFYFMEFLEQVYCRHFTDFWLAAINFKKQLEEITDVNEKQEIQKDALIIYEKYFSLQAINSLHVSDQIRYEVEEKICSNFEDVKNCFNLPLAITQRFLEQKYLLPFIKSHVFCKYLSVLFQKIDATKNDGAHNSKSDIVNSSHKNGTVCNKSSGSAAVANSRRSSINISRSTSNDLNIDTSEINDPDLLWRRSDRTGLSFGHIDELGRYRRNYDVIPTVSDGGDHALSVKPLTTSVKFKKVVRKFINLPEKKIQEEVAWQVAEMIVKDITNVTLN